MDINRKSKTTKLDRVDFEDAFYLYKEVEQEELNSFIIENSVGFNIKKIALQTNELENIKDKIDFDKDNRPRRSQFNKVYECWNLIENKEQYDLFVRLRFDVTYRKPIKFEKNSHINVFGGWNPGGKLASLGMREYVFDGFAYGTYEDMKHVCEFGSRYREYDSLPEAAEFRFRAHLLNSPSSLRYIGERNNKRKRWYAIIR